MFKNSSTEMIQAAFHCRHPVRPGSTFAEFLAALDLVATDLPVRPVVTPSGRRGRGYTPAFKALERCRYESGLENEAWYVLDTSSLVLSFMTHPLVLRVVGNDGRRIRYTPDAVVRLNDGRGLVLEVKSTFYLRSQASRDRVIGIAAALKKLGIAYALLLDLDLVDQLGGRIQDLWHRRPPMGRWSPRKNPDLWDPNGCAEPTREQTIAWLAGRRECDERLNRIVRHDVEVVVESLSN